MKRIISSLIILILTALSMMNLTSCSSGNAADKYLVYYTNAAGNDIIFKESYINDSENMSPEELTRALLDKMADAGPDDDDYRCAKPDSVALNHFFIENGQINLDFNSGYLEMSNVQEILLRAALVLTIIQEPEISSVIVTIDSVPLTDSVGRPVGAMNASNFVNVLLGDEGMLKQETDLTVFFTDETGQKLIPAKYHFTISNSNTSMEEYIMQQLIEGPAIESTYRTMAEDVELISIITSDYVCYVNFGRNFLEQEQPVSDEILIYSIVNSLCTLPYVRSVQFLVEGNSDAKLHTVFDLSTPFSRNRELEQ